MTDRVEVPVCYRHPDRPTRLSCSECGRPICTECSHDAAVGQKCPEHAKSGGRHRVVDARRTTGRGAAFEGAPFVKWTIVVTVGIYLVSTLSDRASGGISDLTEWLYTNLWHENRGLADGELWRMVSHALLHSRGFFLHILFNMFALYLFGPQLERRVGSAAFAGLYVGSAATGSALTFLLGDLNMVPAVGASGAVFGLFGAWLYVGWRTRHTPQGRAQFNNLAVLIAINLALPFIPRFSNIAWQAHLGGLIGGLMIAAAWAQWAVGSPQPERRRVVLAAAVLALAVAAVLVA